MTNDNAHAAYSRYEAEMRKLSQLENSSWNRGLSKYFFGEECTPIRLFEAALATDHSLSDLESQFLEFLDRPFTRVVDEVSLEEQCNSLFQGILHTLIAACQYQSDVPIDFPSFTTAVERFNTAWPIDATVNDTIGSDSAEKDELFTTAFGAVEKQASAGFFIAWDLLDRVLAQTRAQRRDTAHRSVQTHALFYDGGAGYVGLLTVDLIKDGGSAFCPDPYWMGCVGLARCDNPGDPTNFHEAMQRAWSASGIAGTGWRGRWRITKRMPRYDKDYVPDDFPCQFLMGCSLEAATLACLWAANGGIPGDESFRSDDAMPLDDNLAVTANTASLHR